MGANPKKESSTLSPKSAPAKETYSAWWLLVAIIAVPYAGWLMLQRDSTPEASVAQCNKSDLQCLGRQASVVAGGACQRAVERNAKYSAKWTDGALDSKFSLYVWLDDKSAQVTLMGDKVQFQNGFGAYTNMFYTCDVDMSGNQPVVLNASASAGYLPTSR